MTESEWLACEDPDLLLEAVETGVDRAKLTDFVRRCWERVAPFLSLEQRGYSAVDEFAALADQLTDHDAALYAAEAVLKAARWAPVFEPERKQQAALLRRIFSRPS